MEVKNKPTDCLEFWCEDLVHILIGKKDYYECASGIEKFKYCKVKQVLKYRNNFGWCSYPFCEGGGIDYCWGFASDIDKKSSKSAIHKSCKLSCEYYKEKKNAIAVKIIL